MSFFTPQRLIVIAIIGLILGGIALAAAQPATFNTEGGEGSQSGYAFRTNFDATEYATAWITNGDSESITVTAGIKRWATITGAEVKWVRFNFYLEGVWIRTVPPTGHINVPDINVWEGGIWYTVAAETIHFQGEIVGRLTVKLEVFINDVWPWPDFQGEIAWDGAYLKSGRGEIYLYGDQGPFEEGSTALVYVRTGFAHNDGWYVKLYPPITRGELFDAYIVQTVGNDKRLIVSIEIETGWFTPSGNYLDNEFQVELWNDLFDIGFVQLFAIDFLERAPGQPVLSWMAEGQHVIITAFSQVTFTDIDGFVVWAWYGDRTMPSTQDEESWILYREEFNGVASGVDNVTMTFTVPSKNKDGAVVVKVLATDVDGRTSEPSFLSFVVEQGSFEGGDPLGQPYIWGIIVYVLIAAGLILGAVVAIGIYLSSENIWLALLAFILILGGFLVAAYVAGNNPDVALAWGVIMKGVNIWSN